MKKQTIFISSLIITGVLVFGLAPFKEQLYGHESQKITQAGSPTYLNSSDTEDEDDGQITLEKYNRIKNGMAVSEVTAIIGSQGEVIGEAGEPGTDYHTLILQYRHNEKRGAIAIFTFYDGKLGMKVQEGLE